MMPRALQEQAAAAKAAASCVTAPIDPVPAPADEVPPPPVSVPLYRERRRGREADRAAHRAERHAEREADRAGRRTARGSGSLKDRAVWACSTCEFRSWVDRQYCVKCYMRSLGHVIEFGGIVQRFHREVQEVMDRRRLETTGGPTIVLPGPPPDVEPAAAPAYAASGPSSSTGVSPPMPSASAGNTFNTCVSLGLKRAARRQR